ncbi:MAG TPA: PIN domain-containing protein [Thermoanaerobaculia bacterium]|nr:PIN domain-containing protein [Thermoanaerobaculia bacterium]
MALSICSPVRSYPQEIPPVIEQDPDDDAVLACAVAARAEVIISGDRHLLNLGRFQAIQIITAAEAVARR